MLLDLDVRAPYNIELRMKGKDKNVVIAIDGPAASGKGTLAKRLAAVLGIAYLDTGKLYRAVGFKLLQENSDATDHAVAAKAAESISASDIKNHQLYQEKVGNLASIVSAIPAVREALLDFQRNFAKSAKGAVLDGRDIGTVVCPEADIKLFVTASLDARARRRYEELVAHGDAVTYDQIFYELEQRDKRDRERSVAPLKIAEGAVYIDTTGIDPDEVFERTLAIVLEKLPALR